MPASVEARLRESIEARRRPGTPAGAHAKRRRAAAAVGLPVAYRAWAADSATSSAARFTHASLPWAELMQRVWALDVLECDECRGRMRIVAAIHSWEVIRKILECLGLPSRAPPIAPAEPETEPDDLDPGVNPESES